MTRAAVVAALALATLCNSPVAAQPSRDELLRRVAGYVQRFVDDLTNVVGEEVYRQEFRLAAPRRRLKSEFMLVKYPGEEQLFLTFRDVLEVDGRPVRDQQERVTKLFLEPFASAIRRAGEIQREGVRHSLESGRLVDPLEVIAYVQAPYQQNFQFTLQGRVRTLGPDVREISLTQIVERGAAQVPIRARVWASESSGRVLKTELMTGIRTGVRITTTTFGADRGLGIDVPLTMRDQVPYRTEDEFIGTATYSNFRRFQVRTQLRIDPDVNPR